MLYLYLVIILFLKYESIFLENDWCDFFVYLKVCVLLSLTFTSLFVTVLKPYLIFMCFIFIMMFTFFYLVQFLSDY